MAAIFFLCRRYVYRFAIKKHEDHDIQNYNFARCFVRVWNLVAPLEEDSSMKVFENIVLRRIFGPK